MTEYILGVSTYGGFTEVRRTASKEEAEAWALQPPLQENVMYTYGSFERCEHDQYLNRKDNCPICTPAREAKEQQLNALAQELYQESNRMFRPLFPWVFVRVLKKQQQVGSIFLPDIDQNKTVAEGIVLATWSPFEQTTSSRVYCDICGYEVIRCQHQGCNSPLRYGVVKRSAVKPGDHVLFSYWSGLPITGHKPEYYRVVKETDWSKDKDGGIFAKVEYSNKSTGPLEKLEQLVWKYSDMIPDEELAQKIEEQFLLVDRDGESVTLSGR